MTSITHVLSETGDSCALCGAEIPPNEAQQPLWQTGDKIGVIHAFGTNPVSYQVGIHDSNEKCTDEVQG